MRTWQQEVNHIHTLGAALGAALGKSCRVRQGGLGHTFCWRGGFLLDDNHRDFGSLRRSLGQRPEKERVQNEASQIQDKATKIEELQKKYNSALENYSATVQNWQQEIQSYANNFNSKKIEFENEWQNLLTERRRLLDIAEEENLARFYEEQREEQNRLIQKKESIENEVKNLTALRESIIEAQIREEKLRDEQNFYKILIKPKTTK